VTYENAARIVGDCHADDEQEHGKRRGKANTAHQARRPAPQCKYA
jgi:hypothetical protein